jgi:hypothetical protein
MHFTSPHTCYVPRLSHSPSFDHSSNVWWGVQIMKFLVMKCYHSLVTSFLLGPNILVLSNLSGNNISLHSSLRVSDHVSHLHETRKMIVLYNILIFTFSDSKLEDKIFCNEWQQVFPDFNLLLISSWLEYWLVKVVSQYLNSFIILEALLHVFKLLFWLHSYFGTRQCA